nr:putative reverse transcriptase domain-containing protein [Tanacetum cinerariifolium]
MSILLSLLSELDKRMLEMMLEGMDQLGGKKVKFTTATLKGPALTWWNAKVAAMGLETVNQMPWTEMKQLMTAEFCLIEEIQKIEHELWNLKVKEYNIVAYTHRFNELALMCPRVVGPKRVKVDACIRGLTDNIKGEVTSSKPANLNEAIRMARKLMEQKLQARDEIILEGKKRKWENFQSGRTFKVEIVVVSAIIGTTHAKLRRITKSKFHKCWKIGHKARYCKEKNVATGANVLPILTCYDCGEQGASYEVELADGRVVSTNTILKGCTLNLVNHIFEIDLMLIELGTFDIIIGMDWLVKHDSVIVCGKKVVCIRYGNKMLIVESDKGVSRLTVISCIKAHVPIIRNSPEVFPEEFPRLPPPRQVEFLIELVSGATPVTRAPYRLALSEMKELSVQLQELLEKGFIFPSSSS